MTFTRRSESSSSGPRRGAKRAIAFAVLVLLLGTGAWHSAAPAGETAPPVPILGPWIEHLRWLNAPPVASKSLAGKVVIVEFWTYDCINCRRTVPAMKRLEETYRKSSDVALIGFHTPELREEFVEGNVRKAIQQLGIAFPVAQDNDEVAWDAFGNHYWPALYLIDRRGQVREVHAGELHVGTATWDGWLRSIERLRRERA